MATSRQAWFGSAYFTVAINLPYLVITSYDEFAKRSIAGSAAFRSGFSLSFLYKQEEFCEAQDEKAATQPDKTCLYQATWSAMVTGTSERY
jgi:hypothetical protein